MKTIFAVVFLCASCASCFAQGTFSGYLKQVDTSGYFERFAVASTNGATYNFAAIGVVAGTAAVDDGSGTCGTNFRVEGQRGFGASLPYFAAAGLTGPQPIFTLSPVFSTSGTVYLPAQQVGGCTSPAGDINVTATYSQ
jgi:hypothetical protein